MSSSLKLSDRIQLWNEEARTAPERASSTTEKMDRTPNSSRDPGADSMEEQNHNNILQCRSPFATASFSLSLTTNFFTQHRIAALLFSQPNNARVLSSLPFPSLCSSTLFPPIKFSSKSIISNSLLDSPLTLAPRRPFDPSNAAAIRRSSIVWFRNDLRVHDNECLNAAHNESTSVLPVYCFDPRDYGKSCSGFDRAGPNRTSFLIEAVSDLRRNLQARGSELVVRIGKPESVLVELAKTVGADAVYAHRDVSHGEVKAENTIEAALKEEGVEVKYFWGSTLYHADDLPFKLEEMPTNYGGFREKVSGLEIRKTIEALDLMKGLPAGGNVEIGDIPSLTDLGITTRKAMPQDGSPNTMVGGETEALKRVKKFAAEFQAQPPKGASDSSSIYGANFSCKISPWLATGCVSPRFMFDALKSTTMRTMSLGAYEKDAGGGSGETGSNWLMFELLWRDFFRFITKKCSSARVVTVPATASTATVA